MCSSDLFLSVACAPGMGWRGRAMHSGMKVSNQAALGDANPYAGILGISNLAGTCPIKCSLTLLWCVAWLLRLLLLLLLRWAALRCGSISNK